MLATAVASQADCIVEQTALLNEMEVMPVGFVKHGAEVYHKA